MADWKLPFIRYFQEVTIREKSSALGVELEHFIVEKKNRKGRALRG